MTDDDNNNTASWSAECVSPGLLKSRELAFDAIHQHLVMHGRLVEQAEDVPHQQLREGRDGVDISVWVAASRQVQQGVQEVLEVQAAESAVLAFGEHNVEVESGGLFAHLHLPTTHNHNRIMLEINDLNTEQESMFVNLRSSGCPS